ncbi:esterase family protein [Nocardia yunnanensis]|uniref:Esterase family protein n=1 Tax=Nocardia yunnanensis TaxID=2382165 RepID=A0A386ZG70_9NOCA|nr:alpha/beta hydrolase family protein [Nocardia yunnanensis]AYF75509.1 esterase family protein [Nocardia yunnanensis]
MTSGRGRRRIVAVGIALVAAVSGTGVASAVEPLDAAAVAADGSHIDHVVQRDDRRSTVSVYSAAMNRIVQISVIRAADNSAPRPTLYLLNGAEDGLDQGGNEVSWETKTDVVDFLADQNVNVVNVLDGRYTYYTDWQSDDPMLGRNKWTTFLTQELPPLMNAALDASGRNAIVGVSMSATSALALAESAPGLYQGVGSFSGCAQTSTDPGRRYLQAVVLSGGGNPWNIWGPDDAPAWAANDPSTPANLEKLRGTDLYIAAGTDADSAAAGGGRIGASSTALESTVETCTRTLQSATEALDLPATFAYLPGGGHNWPSWQQDLHAAWPGIAQRLGR